MCFFEFCILILLSLFVCFEGLSTVVRDAQLHHNNQRIYKKLPPEYLSSMETTFHERVRDCTRSIVFFPIFLLCPACSSIFPLSITPPMHHFLLSLHPSIHPSILTKGQSGDWSDVYKYAAHCSIKGVTQSQGSQVGSDGLYPACLAE